MAKKPTQPTTTQNNEELFICVSKTIMGYNAAYILTKQELKQWRKNKGFNQGDVLYQAKEIERYE